MTNKKAFSLVFLALILGIFFESHLVFSETTSAMSTTTPAKGVSWVSLPQITKTLSFGSTGDDVKILQTWLAKDPTIYPLGLVTGYFGPATREAVKKFQALNNIVSSGTEFTTGYGRLGPKTRATINMKLSSNKAPTTVASTAAETQTVTHASGLFSTVTNLFSNISNRGGSGSAPSSGGTSGGSSGGGSTQIISHPDPTYKMPARGVEQVMAISSDSSDPVRFTSADINPLTVYPGDRQDLKVVISSNNPIVSVTAVTTLDSKTLTLNLVNDGTGTNTWKTSWIVNDTIVQTYKTKFTATDSVGNTQNISMAWSDPCSGWTNADSSVPNGGCTIGTGVVDGVDGFNLTIPAGQTLTLNTNSTLVFNPGKSITITKPGASIVKLAGATIKKGYMFYPDADNDGYTPSKNVSGITYNASALVSGYVRVTTAYSLGLDPADNNASIYQTLNCYVDSDGDGYTVGGLVGVSAGASCPSGYRATSLGTDCNDASSGVTSGSYTVGANCNPNSCGTYGGTITNACTGSCSGSTPATPYTVGGACSNTTACGTTNGTYTDACNGNCNAADPTASRTRYSPSTTSCGTYACASESQSCSNGSWSGSYTGTSCAVSTRTGYTIASVPCNSSCTTQAQTCTSGGWDGSGVGSCSVAAGSYTVGASCNVGACNPGTYTNACTGSCSTGLGALPDTYYVDADGDGFCGSGSTSSCTNPGSPYTLSCSGTDCNDSSYDPTNTCAPACYPAGYNTGMDYGYCGSDPSCCSGSSTWGVCNLASC